MKSRDMIRHCIVILLFIFLIPSSYGIGYLLWGTQFLYKPYKFNVDVNAPAQNGKSYQERFGNRGDRYIAALNQTVVEKNNKLYDVEDSTKSYKSPLSYWRK